MTGSGHRELHERIRVEECTLLFPSLLPRLPAAPRILEIGAGNGIQSLELSRLGPVVAVDPSVVPRPAARVSWVRAAAERLPFAAGSFDMVYSSSVIEHIEDLDAGLGELRRVARADALHVHVVPTHVWKVLATGSHYGVLARNVARRLLGRRPARRDEPADLAGWRPPPVTVSRWRRLLPEIHGTSRSNWAELVAFHPSSWAALFARHGLEVVEVLPLLCYAPPNWPFVPPNRLGARIGLSSCKAFVMRSV